jgi:hypothetical protein
MLAHRYKGKTPPASAPAIPSPSVGVHPIRTINSALHTLGGYLDVGNDDLFQGNQPWLKEISEQLMMEKTSSSIQSFLKEAAIAKVKEESPVPPLSSSSSSSTQPMDTSDTTTDSGTVEAKTET